MRFASNPRFPGCRVRPVTHLLMVTMVLIVSGCGSRDSNSGGPMSDSPYKQIRRSAPRQAAIRMRSQNYLKQIGIAMHTFHELYGQLPIGESDRDNYPIIYRDGKPLLSWRVYLLPFLEQEQLYDQFKLNEPWDSPHNIKLLDQMPDQYKSLDYQGLGNKTVVLGLSGPGGIFEPGDPAEAHPTVRFRDITDGTSQVVLVVMAHPGKAIPWTQPGDFVFNPENPREGLVSANGEFLSLFTDGSAWHLGKEVSPETLLKLFQYRDGAPIESKELQ
ncbi:MAG: DUF1559 domain-containing protein [Planctomycetaceae bacterium]|nr:DUF1559 domain-containing protein [Planctomycetaceae bacterium]